MAFNVLIVDDSSTMRAVIKRTINISGFKVGELWEASDGNEALKILNDQWVDLVLSDINMPNMNGIELISRMKQDPMMKSIPVVMVTTEGSEKRIQECMEIGASGYIKKPFKPEDIKRTLNKIMGEPEDGGGETEEEFDGLDF